MIGAMPAVAVRHERRRNEKRIIATGRRPSQLPLQLGRAPDCEPTPSPDHHRLRNELYVCGKVAALHAVVGSLLLGIVVLVVGLVQLSPGAEAAQHRYYLMGAGGALVGGGVLGGILRCICLHWYNRKFREEAEAEHDQAAHKNGVSVVESGHGPCHDGHKSHDHKSQEHKSQELKSQEHKSQEHKSQEHKSQELKSQEHKSQEHKSHDHKSHDHKSHDQKVQDNKDKPKLKAQASMGRDVDLIKQPSATSDT